MDAARHVTVGSRVERRRQTSGKKNLLRGRETHHRMATSSETRPPPQLSDDLRHVGVSTLGAPRQLLPGRAVPSWKAPPLSRYHSAEVFLRVWETSSLVPGDSAEQQWCYPEWRRQRKTRRLSGASSDG